MEMASRPDGLHFNQFANDSATRSRAKVCKWRSYSDDRNTATDMSPSNDSVSAAFTPVVDRIAPMPAMMASHYRRDLEDLLWARTEAVAAPDIDFSSFSTLWLDQWEAHSHSRCNREGFHTYSRRLTPPNTPAATEVLVTGELACSLAEAAALLRCPGQVEFNYAMSSMHERSFQRGSVVHSFTSTKCGASDAFPGCEFLTRYRCVKTACFARPRLALFDGNERWCFLEEFAPFSRGSASSPTGFTLSQRSLQPGTLPRAVRPPIELVRRGRSLGFKRSNKRARQLVGLSLGCWVEPIAGSYPAAVRLVFYGCCSDEERGDFTIAQRRMRRLARGVLNLPAIVRRRRMSAQVPADVWSITRLASKRPSEPSSSRCVSCSQALHLLLLAKRTRCYLCAHFVCSRCWVRQPLEAANGRSISVIICSNCMHSVQSCNYAHLAASSLSGRGSGSSASTSSRLSMVVGGLGGEVSFHTTEVLPDSDDAPEPGHAVIAYLENIFSGHAEEDASGPTESRSSADNGSMTQTAVNVLQQLVLALDEGVNRVLAHCPLKAENPEDPEFDVTLTLQRLRTQFEREVLPLEACVLSNAVTRTYPIDTSGGSARVAAVPVGPIPPNEANRIEAIVQEQLLFSRGSEDLVLVCELATRELNCMASLVSVVGSTIQYVLASNSPLFQNAELPREHTLCQHLLMGDRPMFVQYPEADVRFCSLNLVVDFGIQFYAGFPIFSRDGLSVVGSLCCLDVRSREMTQSQYSTLLHLTSTASNIIAEKCRQPRMLQPLQKRRYV
ncbi:hypothetical protein PHYPSEUDO_013336 [Phytophthora pseudosyringae]|uniref:FYVE-type domain-containing protein n=1 Tax=Phytophthora pseudosyringae TaxID=221518 RepID=A0A8T1W5K4_9STRA|nr:hypothetical protein PHYPSEUDO_013336 [Phytophthora pseudosyringae]